MVGLNGHEFEQAPGVGGRQGSLVCCGPRSNRVGPDLTTELMHICGASLVALLVKNLPAMQETPIQFLVWEYPLEKG